ICTESSIPRFLRALLNFLEWLDSEGHHEFLSYIRTYYLGHSRLREWAPCYRYPYLFKMQGTWLEGDIDCKRLAGLKKRADVRRERHLAAPPVLPVRFESDKLESELCAICHSKYPPNQGDEAVDENQQQPEFPWHYCEKICKLWMHDACIAEKHPNIDKCYTCNRVF
ncbi:hypothetical protein PRIPAC_74924, partial [Pristionchus pacificus]|uniref:Uncharacterized protein n=1 Tax=Pristionchus pacificus TaxID=54126 RepID=A0A2A6CZA6_PRIPA